jgi:hypothetical protein
MKINCIVRFAAEESVIEWLEIHGEYYDILFNHGACTSRDNTGAREFALHFSGQRSSKNSRLCVSKIGVASE